MWHPDVVKSLVQYHDVDPEKINENCVIAVGGDVWPGMYAMVIDGEPRIVTITRDGNAIAQSFIFERVEDDAAVDPKE